MICALSGCKSTENADDIAAETTQQPPIEAFITPDPTQQPTLAPAGDPMMEGEDVQQTFTATVGSGEGAIDPEEQAVPGMIVFETDPPAEEGDLSGEDGGEIEPVPTEEPVFDPYTYSSLTNQKLKVKFLYPEGWTSDPSTDTITMVEPVEEGEVPARFSVTSFKYTYNDRDISSGRLKTHLTDYLKTLVTGYNDYQLGDTGYDMAFAESTAIYATYIAIKGNAFIQGIAVVGYGKNGRVYCMHFCCEQDDYPGHADLISRLAAQVTPIN